MIVKIVSESDSLRKIDFIVMFAILTKRVLSLYKSYTSGLTSL